MTNAVNLASTSATGFSGRNRIINGNFDIWQRGTSFTLTSGFAYSADRWYAGAASGTVTRQTFTLGQTEVPNNPTYYARYVISSNSQNYEWLQKIEGVSTFAGQNATISFYARQTTGTVTFSGRIVQDFGTGGSPSSVVVTSFGNPSLTTSWQKFTFTVAVPSISGKTLGTNNNDSLWLSLQVSNTGTGTIDFAQFQMEVGSVATPFEQELISQTLAKCQRYLYRLTPTTSSTNPFFATASMYNGTSIFASGQFPQQMRAAPTLTLEGAVSNYSFFSMGSGTYLPATSLALNAVTTNSFFLLQGSVASGGTSGQISYLTGNGQNTYGLQLSAEL
jgi:hypothetical protein